MNRKELTSVFREEIVFLLGKYGYKRLAKDEYLVSRDFGFDKVGFGFSKYGNDYELGLAVSRRYDKIEEIIALVNEEIETDYWYNGKDLTLRINEDYLDGKRHAGKRYRIPDGNYTSAVKEVEYALINKFIPFLESINTLSKFHDFINNPPNTMSPKSSFFYGDIILRKMVIAKLAGRDYEAVCEFVYNIIHNDLKAEDEEEFRKYSKAYDDLIKALENVRSLET